MQAIYKLSVIALLALSQQAFAADEVCAVKGASLNCSSGDVAQIEHTGSVKLKGTNVTDNILVTGSFKAIDAKMQQLAITGSTDIAESAIMGDTAITGNTKSLHVSYNAPVRITGNLQSEGDTFASSLKLTGKLQAASSEFHQPINTNSPEILFSDSSAAEITVHAAYNPKVKQSVYLENGSHVDGKIVFEGNNGMVFVADDSSVGEVIGGTVYRAD